MKTNLKHRTWYSFVLAERHHERHASQLAAVGQKCLELFLEIVDNGENYFLPRISSAASWVDSLVVCCDDVAEVHQRHVESCEDFFRNSSHGNCNFQRMYKICRNHVWYKISSYLCTELSETWEQMFLSPLLLPLHLPEDVSNTNCCPETKGEGREGLAKVDRTER